MKQDVLANIATSIFQLSPVDCKASHVHMCEIQTAPLTANKTKLNFLKHL